MLFSLYPFITKHYFILSFIICLGTLQWTAARNGKPALSLLGRWGLGWLGTLIGGGLVGGGFVWFFTATPGLLQSGLAGGELSTLFISGGVCALVIARLAGWLWGRLTSRLSATWKASINQANPSSDYHQPETNL